MKVRPVNVLRSGAALALTLVATGCYSPVLVSVSEQKLRATGAYEIVGGLDVPRVRGSKGCGAQALATVMAHHDPERGASETVDELPWHRTGATPVDLLLAARQRGFEATIVRGDWDIIADSVRRGRPALVMFDAGPIVWSPAVRIQTRTVMHWSVVSGIATDGTKLLLAARNGNHNIVKRVDFLERWAKSDNCTIVVTASAAVGDQGE